MPRRLGSRFRRTCVRGFPGLRLLDHPDRFLRNDVGRSQMLGCGWSFGRLGIRLDVGGRLATKNIRYRLAGGLRVLGVDVVGLRVPDRLAFDRFLLALCAAMTAAP